MKVGRRYCARTKLDKQNLHVSVPNGMILDSFISQSRLAKFSNGASLLLVRKKRKNETVVWDN